MSDRNFAPFPILTTGRLRLRQLEPDDAPEIFLLRSDPEINTYLGRQAATTIRDAANFINAVNANIAKNDSVYWAITVDNEIAGTICMFSFSNDNTKCEIGYELLTKFQGKGIMKEAAEKVITYAFNTLHVHQIEAVLHMDNRASIKLLKQLSFILSNESIDTEPDLVSYYLTNTSLNVET